MLLSDGRSPAAGRCPASRPPGIEVEPIGSCNAVYESLTARRDRVIVAHNQTSPGRGSVGGQIPAKRHRPGELQAPALTLSLVLQSDLLVVALLERGAENVAQRRAGIGRAVLRDRLLLLGHFERLDRHATLWARLVELGDAGVDLLADREALGALLGAVAGEFGRA